MHHPTILMGADQLEVALASVTRLYQSWISLGLGGEEAEGAAPCPGSVIEPPIKGQGLSDSRYHFEITGGAEIALHETGRGDITTSEANGCTPGESRIIIIAP